MQVFCQTISVLTIDVVTIGTDPLPELYSQAVDAGLGHTAGHSRHSPGTSDLLTQPSQPHITLHTRAVNEYSRSFTEPEKGPFLKTPFSH